MRRWWPCMPRAERMELRERSLKTWLRSLPFFAHTATPFRRKKVMNESERNQTLEGAVARGPPSTQTEQVAWKTLLDVCGASVVLMGMRRGASVLRWSARKSVRKERVYLSYESEKRKKRMLLEAEFPEQAQERWGNAPDEIHFGSGIRRFRKMGSVTRLAGRFQGFGAVAARTIGRWV